MSAGSRERTDPWLLCGSLAVCLGILFVKVLLIWRIDVNWDEFFYLSQVFALSRGDLGDLFQATHTHLFRWLTAAPGDEMTWIVIGRATMLGLLVVTAALIWALARRWASAQAALLAPLCFLATSPVLKHGGSFRSDSLLVPLTIAVLLLFTDRSSSRRATLAAAACFGIALAITIKALLLGPVLVAVAWLDQPRISGGWRPRAAATIRRLAEFAVVAGCVAGAILMMHWMVLPHYPAESASAYASGVMRTSLIDVPFVPQRPVVEAFLRQNLLSWILMAGGAAAAAVQRRYVPLAFVLSLLPILFYRNTFPYYYVVMLAPASVLAALAGDQLRTLLGDAFGEAPARRILLVIAAGLTLQAGIHLFVLRDDNQLAQRAVIAAVHQVFPEPVPYIDHSGMMASFRKVNFFMSTWGVQAYRRRGTGFMRQALDQYRPPLLLANRPIIEPGSSLSRRLLPADQRLIEESYQHYWGPIWIAGTAALLSADNEVTLRVPFPGRYSLRARQPVVVDGALRKDGEILTFTEADSEIVVRAGPGVSGGLQVRLMWSEVHDPPPDPAPPMPLYTGL